METLFSTKKVKRKMIRIIILSIQQYMKKGVLSNIRHVKSKEQLADAFTKTGAHFDLLLEVLRKGKFPVNI